MAVRALLPALACLGAALATAEQDVREVSTYDELRGAVEATGEGAPGVIRVTAHIAGWPETVVVKRAVRLEGACPGSERCLLDATAHVGEQSRHIMVMGGNAAHGYDGSLEVSNLTFRGGVVNGLFTRGGAIDNEDGVLLARHCDFQNNSVGDVGDGGAVFSTTYARFEGCTFEGNYAAWGGATYNFGVIEFHGCVFRENSVGFDGGAVYVSMNPPDSHYRGIVVGCTFEDNFAPRFGADVRLLERAELYIVGSSIVASADTVHCKEPETCVRSDELPPPAAPPPPEEEPVQEEDGEGEASAGAAHAAAGAALLLAGAVAAGGAR